MAEFESKSVIIDVHPGYVTAHGNRRREVMAALAKLGGTPCQMPKKVGRIWYASHSFGTTAFAVVSGGKVVWVGEHG